MTVRFTQFWRMAIFAHTNILQGSVHSNMLKEVSDL